MLNLFQLLPAAKIKIKDYINNFKSKGTKEFLNLIRDPRRPGENKNVIKSILKNVATIKTSGATIELREKDVRAISTRYERETGNIISLGWYPDDQGNEQLYAYITGVAVPLEKRVRVAATAAPAAGAPGATATPAAATPLTKTPESFDRAFNKAIKRFD